MLRKYQRYIVDPSLAESNVDLRQLTKVSPAAALGSYVPRDPALPETGPGRSPGTNRLRLRYFR